MRIGIAYSLAPADRGPDGPDDRFEEFDKPETIEAIAEAIRGDGHDVALLGDGREFLARVMADPPDFVFNIAEGEGISPSRESRIPAACELLGLPYSGSDPLTLGMALEKDVARRLVAPGARVPKGRSFTPSGAAQLVRQRIERAFSAEDYPLILKPSFEGSSKGIRGRCLADTPAEATESFLRLSEDYDQPILVEQFIDGPEITVGLIGPLAVELFGAMRIVPRGDARRFVYSLEVKRDWRRLVDYEAPAQLPPDVADALFSAAFFVYTELRCRDVARIDFRLKDGRTPYFIEANPLPGLSPTTSDLVILARGHGIEYEELIRRILRTALARVGLADPVGHATACRTIAARFGTQ